MLHTKGRLRPTDFESCRGLLPGRIGGGPMAALAFAIVLLGALLTAAAWSQTREIERYTYDAAGNIIAIEIEVIDGPPEVTGITPDRVFAGGERDFLITGLNLDGATVTADRPGLNVVAVNAESERIALTLAADAGVETGPAILTVASSAGSDIAEILVRPALPRLIADPVPIVVASSGGETTLNLSLTEPASADWLMEIELDDPTVAEPAVGTIEIVQGQIAIADGVVIAGLEPGSTRLQIRTEGIVLLDTSVISTRFAGLFPGDWEFFARPLGLRKLRPVVLAERGPVVGRELGVVRETNAGPPSLPAVVAASPLNVARGPVVIDVTPGELNPDAIDEFGRAGLTVLGFGLEDVDEVEIVPGDGVVADAVAPSAEGESVAVTLTIEPDAAIGLRKVVVRAGGRVVHAVDPEAASFYLAGNAPRIDSIDPVIMNPGSSALLTVRGANFSATSELSVEPAAGVSIDQPIEISPDQDIIRASVHIAPDAAPGSRLIQVSSAAGQSSFILSPANTLSITLDPLASFTLFDSRHLSIFKGRLPMDFAVQPVSALVGIGKGALVTDIEPRLLQTGSEQTLVIAGQGLDAVSEVVVEPASGLIIGPVAGFDDMIEVTIAVDSDAARGLRALTILTPDGSISLARPELGTLRVVSPQPVVEGVNPVYIEPGAPAVEVTISGRNFQQTETVGVMPQTDLTLGAFSVAADGREITLSIAAASLAEAGPRTVQIVTPAGASSIEPGSANRLYIGNPEARLVTPLTAPVLGIAREVAPGSATVLALGPLLGLQKDVVENIETTRLAFSDRAGVVRGAVLLGIEPSILARGFQGELILPGVELGLGAAVAIESGEGIRITGPVVVEADASDNRFIRVPVAVDEQAPALPHRLVVVEPGANGDAPIPFVTARGGQLQVAGDAPVIASISPIVTLPDEVFTLLIRGLNLEQATGVRVTPDQGISVGSQLSVNADGTELSVSLDVSQAAESGPRLIQVIAPSGETDGTATAANTLTVIEP